MISFESLRKILHDSIDSSPEKVSVFYKTGKGQYAEFDRFLGITNPTLRKITRQYHDLPFDILGQFLNSEFNEERLFALLILVKQYQKASDLGKEEIYQFFLKNIECVNNWNLVDISVHHIVGAHLWNGDREILFQLAKSPNLWKRRIAIVSTWHFIKKQDFQHVKQISVMFLQDEQDLIHKATGWMLREMGKQNLDILLEFLNQHSEQMPRTMLRYAIEKLPEKMRKQYLLK